MAERFCVVGSDAADAAHIARRLRALTMNGSSIMDAEVANEYVYAGCNEFGHGETLLESVVRSDLDGACIAFGDLFYLVSTMNSGRHHSDGILWIGNGYSQEIEERLPLNAIAPLFLSFFGIEPPKTMSVQRYAFLDHASLRIFDVRDVASQGASTARA